MTDQPPHTAATIPDFGTLEDVADRLRRAEDELCVLARRTLSDDNARRLYAKASGVRMALSYVEEAIRAKSA